MALDIFDAPEGVPEFYVDSARISGNVFTIVLEMGVQMNADPAAVDPPATRRAVIVRMSPQHAVALSRLLARNLEKYEKALGHPIPMPESAEDES